MYAYQGTEKHSERQGLTNQRSYFRLTKNFPEAYLTDSLKIFCLNILNFSVSYNSRPLVSITFLYQWKLFFL